MKTLLSILILFLSLTTSVTAQQLNVNWTRFIGATTCCVYLYDAIPSKDGGIVFTGEDDAASSGDMPSSPFAGVFVGKIDSNHNLLWLQIYGGHHGQSICQTPDGGYAILAYTGDLSTPDGYITGYHGAGDMWLLKIDSMGNFLWGNCYGSDSGDEEALSIAITQDNGFILFGISNWYGEDVPFHIGGSEFEEDWFIVKTDSLGNKQWTNDLGGSDDEAPNFFSSILIGENSYYLVSSTFSTDYDCTDTSWHAGVNTLDDYYILKLDTTGDVLWDKSFGGSGYDEIYNAVFDPRDSTIVATGYSTSNDYMVTGNPAGNGMWTIKVNANGNLVWQKILGETYGCQGTSIAINPDSGYVLSGVTSGVIGSSTDNWIFTVDNSCNIIADTIFGGINGNGIASVFPYRIGYIAAGTSLSDSFTEGENYGRLGPGNECFISYITCCPNPVSAQNIITNNEQLIIYPNPSNGITKIEFININTQNSYLIISNTVGQVIYERAISSNEQSIDLNTNDWAKEIYFVQWQGGDGTIVTKKIVIN